MKRKSCGLRVSASRSGARARSPSFRIAAALFVCSASLLSSSIAVADAAAQARRQAHFEALKSHDVFRSMGITNGVPRLVLGAWSEQTDEESLIAFCAVIFDYYHELDSQYTQMVVIDGATGEQFATVDGDGFHKS